MIKGTLIMQYQIFISYRREGGEHLAALLKDRLTRMGYKVFYDVESLRSGDFNEALLSVIEECDDMLVVLPPGGLDRCITDEKDWVRREIVHALECKKNVIPVKLRNFEFPEELPEILKSLPDMNGVSADMEYFDAVLQRIVDQRLVSKLSAAEAEENRRVENLRQQAENGSAEAKNELGIIYENGGLSVIRDEKMALQFYEEAYQEGSLAAGYNLGDICEKCAADLTLLLDYGIQIEGVKTSQEMKEIFFQRAYGYYKEMADKDYAPALYKMGNLLEEKKKFEEAFLYYQRAEKQKYLPALNALGWMYHNGIGTKTDVEKAEELYCEASDAGYPAGIYNYANMIEARAPEQAIRLYESVAYGEEAIPMAAYALGRQYEFGFGDIKNAMPFYERALQGGVGEAETALERCKNTLLR